LRHQLIGPDGKPAGQAQQASLAVDGSAEAGFKASLSVPHPRLWSLEQPNLYTLTTTVLQGGREIDRYDTRFGIRTVVFDKG
jgi:beta-galactosidase